MIQDIFIEFVYINSLRRDLWSDIVITKQKTYFYLRGINFPLILPNNYHQHTIIHKT